MHGIRHTERNRAQHGVPRCGEIYVMIGDGNYLLANSELLTAVQECIKITVILIENEGFQSIHSRQMAKTGTGFGKECCVGGQTFAAID